MSNQSPNYALQRTAPCVTATQHSINRGLPWPNCGLHLTPLRGAGEAGR